MITSIPEDKYEDYRRIWEGIGRFIQDSLDIVKKERDRDIYLKRKRRKKKQLLGTGG